MSQPSCSKPQVDRVRLASYLTIGVTGAMMASDHSEAAIVMLNLTNVEGVNISGPNGGVSSGSFTQINDWLGGGTGGNLTLFNGSAGRTGLDGSNGLYIAINNPGIYANPRNFAAGALISDGSGSIFFTSTDSRTLFKYGVHTSPNFGANSFMGFRFGSGSNFNYGYLEVTWNSSTNTFQILSGAYESTVNTGILAGATPSAVPGAGLSAMALMALGGGAFRRRSRDRVA